VLLYDEKLRRVRSAKLTQHYTGPCEIIAVDDVNVTLKLPKNKTLKLIFVVTCIMLYSSEISPTRCNNCGFILHNG